MARKGATLADVCGIRGFSGCRSSIPSRRDGTSSVPPARWGVLSPSSAPASFPWPGQREGWLLPHYSLTPPVLAGGWDKVLTQPPGPR